MYTCHFRLKEPFKFPWRRVLACRPLIRSQIHCFLSCVVQASHLWHSIGQLPSFLLSLYVNTRSKGSSRLARICSPLSHTLQIFQDTVSDTPAHCHCHGYSGACTFRTCYSDLPEFSVIGDTIKEAFRTDSCKVTSNRRNGAQHAWIPQDGCETVTDRSLLYSHKTPGHCVANPYYGIPGVEGRVCDPDSSGPNSCQHLCLECGLVFPAHTVTEIKQCACIFQFCCDIVCDTCEERRTVYTCSSHYHTPTDTEEQQVSGT